MRVSFFTGLFALAATASQAAPALVTYGGNVVLGTFNNTVLEVGGTVRGGEYSALDVAGKLTFGGTLQLALINSFAPVAGDSFNLFDWGTKAGTFSAVNLPALSPGLLWNQSSLYTSGTLSVGLDAAFTSRVWDGGGGNNDWGTDPNWDLNVEPLNNGTAALTFAGNVRLTPSVNAAWSVASLAFANTAGAFSIDGPQGVTIGSGGIVNNDADAQAIAAPVILAANQTFDAAAGALSLASVALGGNTLTVTGANATTIGSTSDAGAVTKSGAGTLNLNGTQSFDTLTASGGTTNVNGALGSGAAAVSVTGAGTALKFGSVSQTLGSLSIGAGAMVTFTSGVASFGGGAGKASLAAASSSAVVPEPGSLGMLMVGMLGLLGRRRRV